MDAVVIASRLDKTKFVKPGTRNSYPNWLRIGTRIRGAK
jgi:hypothetical protein